MMRLLLMAACVSAIASAGRAETWRMGLELIDQWSIFTCPVTVSDRFWDFTLDGDQLTAHGPEGVTWTTTVSKEGAFKANWIGSYAPADHSYPAEMTGNVHAVPRWGMVHNIKFQCWFRLVPR